MDKENSRDYHVEDYIKEDDPRFKKALKEGVFTQVLCLSAIFLEFFTAFALCPQDSSEMTYIFGLPVWFFVAALIALAAFVIVMVYIGKFAEDISFDARERGGAE